MNLQNVEDKMEAKKKLNASVGAGSSFKDACRAIKDDFCLRVQVCGSPLKVMIFSLFYVPVLKLMLFFPFIVSVAGLLKLRSRSLTLSMGAPSIGRLLALLEKTAVDSCPGAILLPSFAASVYLLSILWLFCSLQERVLYRRVSACLSTNAD